MLRRDDHRVAQHAGLVALDARHFGRLLLCREVLVDDAHAPFLRDGDRQACLGHRVHGGGHERKIQFDVSGELRGEGGVLGEDLGVRWHQQHVVEGERFAEKAHVRGSKKRIVPACNFTRPAWGLCATLQAARGRRSSRSSYTPSPANVVRITLLALACSLPFAASAQWQWLDKDGHKVLSDQGPPADIPANRVLRAPAGRAQPAAAAQEPVATAAPAAAAAAAAPVLPKPSGKDALLEEKRKQAAAAEAARKKAEEDKVAAVRADNCEQARSNKAAYESGVRIGRTSADGDRMYLDDTQRATELKRMEEVIARDCRQQDRQ